ncbi:MULTISPECIES: response regulator [unclassified Janthinobacterium]|uniref:response regulator n=1 Tax=unclassified Janthinobacterium TaxID=2610881 RepID=UPI00161885CB|nr:MULTISPECIES: response regulator [unclassified Janthinobacterium]MBB5606166.1 two-component system response regulator PhcR [Janthinobacterium sp. S3T4]MBB5611962.1 two-component system response regulator PhcR [Janthinobacterium sp. S3M3]
MKDDSRATVLYVDDEELACKYFSHTVGARYRVLTAPGVDAALALLVGTGGEVDVLVTDYRMPGRLGSELLQEVARLYPHIVCMLVTAYADKQVLLELINGGTLFRLLEKPFDMPSMLNALQLAVQTGRERAARRQGLMAIDESLAFLAHELNTPLGAIANFARGIERRAGVADTPAAELVEAAALMHENARYCLAILASFVDTVRLASAGPGMQAGRGRHAASAGQVLAGLLDSYPLSASQRAAITLAIEDDFAISESPNCVALILSSVLGHALRRLAGHPHPLLLFTVGNGHISLNDNGAAILPDLPERLLHDPITNDSVAEPAWSMIFCQRMMHSFGGNIDIGIVGNGADSETTVTLSFPVHIRNEHD